MNKKTKTILKYTIEFLIVGFGVFLGIFVSDWKSQQKIDDNSEKTLDYIVEEINSNISEVEKTIEYQTTLMEAVDSLFGKLDEKEVGAVFYKSNQVKFYKIPNYQGFRFSDLENIMFESAKINGVLKELNISTTQLIARLYQKQDNYISFAEQVNSKLLNINSESKVVDILGIFELVKYDGLSSAKWLLEELKKTKKGLEKIKQDRGYK